MAQSQSKTFLIVLDGFGIGKDSPFNAIQNANMPFYKEISRKFPKSQLLTCGEAVGLPAGVMGNSEVGHMNMGAGRIVYQELTRIHKAIRDKEFAQNPEILNTIQAAVKAKGRVHLMGLLSDAGVHSHMDHLEELIRVCAGKVPVTIHLFTDGRDTPPNTAAKYVKHLGEFIRQYPHVVVGSISGRYFAMDRDQRWDRVEKAWLTLTGKSKAHEYTRGNGIGAALKVIDDSYARNVTDEFIEPVRFEPEAGRGFVADGDSIIFFNFRSDRARQMTRAFTEKGFSGFKCEAPKLSRFLCLTQYDKNFPLPVAFLPQSLDKIFPQILAENNLTQFRTAETEKYAHVTFFFNGGRELVFEGEERLLVPSPRDVATYDLKPEMSAPEVADKLSIKLATGLASFALVNFANPDMVGHTGNYDAAVKALEAVDRCLEKCVSAAMKQDYDVFITSDHGNIECMRDHDQLPHTQHTLNPVPFHYITKKTGFSVEDGILADIAPTLLEVMGLPQPREMTGKSLLRSSRVQ